MGTDLKNLLKEPERHSEESYSKYMQVVERVIMNYEDLSKSIDKHREVFNMTYEGWLEFQNAYKKKKRLLLEKNTNSIK